MIGREREVIVYSIDAQERKSGSGEGARALYMHNLLHLEPSTFPVYLYLSSCKLAGGSWYQPVSRPIR